MELLNIHLSCSEFYEIAMESDEIWWLKLCLRNFPSQLAKMVYDQKIYDYTRTIPSSFPARSFKELYTILHEPNGCKVIWMDNFLNDFESVLKVIEKYFESCLQKDRHEHDDVTYELGECSLFNGLLLTLELEQMGHFVMIQPKRDQLQVRKTNDDGKLDEKSSEKSYCIYILNNDHTDCTDVLFEVFLVAKDIFQTLRTTVIAHSHGKSLLQKDISLSECIEIEKRFRNIQVETEFHKAKVVNPIHDMITALKPLLKFPLPTNELTYALILRINELCTVFENENLMEILKKLLGDDFPNCKIGFLLANQLLISRLSLHQAIALQEKCFQNELKAIVSRF